MSTERMKIREAKAMIDDLREKKNHRLNDWEIKFIDSIYESEWPTLTEIQTNKLNQIWDNHMFS